MAKDYAVITKAIVDNIGGVENIDSVTHCMTRLRFVLKDESKVDAAAVKAIDGVMGVVQQGGQFQIIIGNNMGKAYQEVLKMGNFGEGSQIARGEKMLSNPGFLAKAPKAKVELEQGKLEDNRKQLQEVRKLLESLA